VRSFRLRNKVSKGRQGGIRVGDATRARSVTLPGIGTVAVHDDTRTLRRRLARGRAKICFATVTHRAGRWWVSVNVEAADLHPAQCHTTRSDGDRGGWVGVDRGLSVFAVAATEDGREVARVDDPPKALATGMRRQRVLAKSLSRKQKGSHNRRDAAARLARHQQHLANIRRHFLHQVSNALVKTHDRLVIEDLNVTGMLGNHRLARAISDAGWGEFGRQLRYKQAWRRGAVDIADRWFPSSQLCSRCGVRNAKLTLADRVFTCVCGHSADRDLNAAINLACWPNMAYQDPRTPKHEAGPPMPADGTALTITPRVTVKPARMTREPTFTPPQRLELTTPEKGGAGHSIRAVRHAVLIGNHFLRNDPPADVTNNTVLSHGGRSHVH
jgi:putative transposase